MKRSAEEPEHDPKRQRLPSDIFEDSAQAITPTQLLGWTPGDSGFVFGTIVMRWLLSSKYRIQVQLSPEPKRFEVVFSGRCIEEFQRQKLEFRMGWELFLSLDGAVPVTVSARIANNLPIVLKYSHEVALKLQQKGQDQEWKIDTRFLQPVQDSSRLSTELPEDHPPPKRMGSPVRRIANREGMIGHDDTLPPLPKHAVSQSITPQRLHATNPPSHIGDSLAKGLEGNTRKFSYASSTICSQSRLGPPKNQSQLSSEVPNDHGTPPKRVMSTQTVSEQRPAKPQRSIGNSSETHTPPSYRRALSSPQSNINTGTPAENLSQATIEDESSRKRMESPVLAIAIRASVDIPKETPFIAQQPSAELIHIAESLSTSATSVVPSSRSSLGVVCPPSAGDICSPQFSALTLEEKNPGSGTLLHVGEFTLCKKATSLGTIFSTQKDPLRSGVDKERIGEAPSPSRAGTAPSKIFRQCVTIKQMLASTQCPTTFFVRARVVDFFPFELEDSFIRQCTKCTTQ
ncbi:hypothetical protein C8F04DRAFT_1188052 [Mycena alexandri]|uniref:Uncharacterized protein n=1 Tax=Mycena alexandri TaxID=1745969 RepID=A0AAD6SJE3_9AGAR|nr:hypothetical protein C8F04DRAFT_1188052 [Mycena alexandri]